MKKIAINLLLTLISILILFVFILPIQLLGQVPFLKGLGSIWGPLYIILVSGLFYYFFPYIAPYLSKNDRIPLFKTNPIKTIVLTSFIFIFILFSLLKITHIQFGIQVTSAKILIQEIIAPVFEEFSFRGFLLYSLLKRGANKYLSLIWVSSIFGLLHLLNTLAGAPLSITYIVGTCVGGFLLGAIFIRYGLMISILVHFLWNFFETLLLKDPNLLEKNPLFLIVLVIVGVIVLFLDRRRTISDKIR